MGLLNLVQTSECPHCHEDIDTTFDITTCPKCNGVLNPQAKPQKIVVNSQPKQQIRCSNCNDLIDTFYNLKNCQKCGQPVEGFKEVKKPPFVSEVPVAFFISIVTGIIFMIVLGNAVKFIPILKVNFCIPVYIAAIFSTCIFVYKYLVNLGEDTDDSENSK